MGCGGSKEDQTQPQAAPKPQTNPNPAPPKPAQTNAAQPPANRPVQQAPNQAAYQPPTDFPTPEILAQAQVDYKKANVQKDIDSNGLSKPYPPEQTRRELLQGKDFTTVDDHAKKVPQEYGWKPLQELVDHLMTICNDDIDKLRSFFVWVTNLNLYEDKRLLTKEELPENGSAVYDMLKIYGQLEDYSHLFIKMCKLAKIPCKQIQGKLKTADYRVGWEVGMNHTWCAVFVSGSWRLVDPSCGSSFDMGTQSADFIPNIQTLTETQRAASRIHNQNPPPPKKYKSNTKEKNNNNHGTNGKGQGQAQRVNEFFFLSDPDHLIYSHLPKETPWQLLARPVTETEFKQMVFLRQWFYELGVTELNHYKGKVNTKDGTIEITGSQQSTDRTLQYSYDIYKAVHDGYASKENQLVYKDFAYMQAEGKSRKLTIRTPAVGHYWLKIYAKDLNLDLSFHICSFMVQCQEPCYNLQPPAHNERGEYGPGAEVVLFGLTPISHKGGIVGLENGEAEIVFKIEPGKILDFELVNSINDQSIKKITLMKYLRYYYDDTSVHFFVRVPESGVYVLNIYAKELNTKNKFKNICCYLLYAKEGVADRTPYPAISSKGSKSQRLGLVCDSENLMLKPAENTNPIIHVTDSDSFNLKLVSKNDLDLWMELQNIEDFSHYFWLEKGHSSTYTVFGRFPQCGMYSFQIHGSLRNSGSVLRELYRFVLIVDEPSRNAVPFPTVQMWDPEFTLLQPKYGYLEQGKTQRFELKVPPSEGSVTDVYIQGICMGEFSLDAAGNKWQADIYIEEEEQELELILHNKEDKMLGFLKFAVLTNAEMQELKKQQQRAMIAAKDRKRQMEVNKANAEAAGVAKEKEQGDDANQRQEEFKKNQEDIMAQENEILKMEEDCVKQKNEMEEEILKQRNTETVDKEFEEATIQNEAKKIYDAVDPSMIRLMELREEQKRKLIREKLKEGIRLKDKWLLSRAIQEYREERLDDSEDIFEQAELALEIEIARERLVQATKEHDVDEIESTILDIKLRQLLPYLQAEVAEAERLLESIKRLQNEKLKVLAMDNQTFSEIHSYTNPPDVVQYVMSALLLLLGNHEGTTKTWGDCRKLCSPNIKSNLKRQIQNLEMKDVDPEIAARVQEILENVEFKKVHCVSAGLATFYVWALAFAEEVVNLSDDDEENEDAAQPRAADIDRQIEIFGNPNEISME